MRKIINFEEKTRYKVNPKISILDNDLEVKTDIETVSKASQVLINAEGLLTSPITITRLAELLFSKKDLSILEGLNLCFDDWKYIINKAMTIAVNEYPQGLSKVKNRHKI